MFTLIKSLRFIYVSGLYLIAQVAFALPTTESGQSGVSIPSVLVQGQVLPEGLNSMVALSNGMNGSYQLGGKIVYFEMRRGSRTPKYLRDGDPATPDYEIDVRFMDQEGKPFLTQIGGDSPIDSAWAEAAPKLKNDEEAKTDFELTIKAIESLKKLKFNKKFMPERQALMNLVPIVESAQVIEKVERVPTQQLGVQPLAVANTYRQRVEIHDKSCCLGLGRHRATIGKYITDAGVTTTAVVTCNHGTCANQMALKCSWTSAYPGNRTKILNNDITCTTPYNPTSVFGHNSNDDTDLQYQAVRYNIRPSTKGGTCNNSGVNNEPTGCY
jgi:hypothetical protein